MLPLVLILLAQAPGPSNSRVTRVERVPGNRTPGDRIGGGAALAFFEAFSSSGAGTFGACSTTPPTGAKGEVLTFTRASSATCTKTAAGGFTVTSGIAVGDLVAMTNDQSRAEYDSASTLGLLVESTAGTADDLRPEELDNAAWTSTATVTANAAVPPNNTNQVSNAEQLSDVSGAAFQGSCQVIVTTSATQHTTFFHVRGGTATSAQVTQVGTGSSTGDCSATVTGLSGTTWNVLSCTSPAAYAGTLTAVTVCVNVGDTVAATGTIMAWGSDHKVNATYRTSYVPGRTSSAASRATEAASFVRAFFSTSGGASLALSVQEPSTGPVFTRFYVAGDTSNRFQLDATSLTNYVGRYNVAFAGPTPTGAGTTRAGAALQRIALAWDGVSVGTLYAPGGGVYTDTVAKGAWTGGTLDFLVAGDGIVSRVCLDPSPARCR